MEDAARLFAWRNAPATRAMSLCTEEVSWPDHLTWLKDSIARDDRQLFIGELSGTPVGTVRLDHREEAEISITLAPNHRGRGLPLSLLRAAIPDTGCLARIRISNLAT